MPSQSLTNPAGAYGYTDPQAAHGVTVVPMVNGSTLTAMQKTAVQFSTVAVSSSVLLKFVQPASGSAANAVSNLIGIVDKNTEPGAIGDVIVEGVTLVAVSSTAIPTINDLLTSSTSPSLVTTNSTQSVTGLLKTSTSTGVTDGVVIAQALSSTLDGSSSTSIGAYIYAYVHKM